MKRHFFSFLAIILCTLVPAFADDNVRAAQGQLRKEGFYFRKLTGIYDRETATAITRYQIRHGLPISGKLDAETTKSLGIAAARAGRPLPSPGEDVWRYLRKSDRQFIERLQTDGIASEHPVSSLPRQQDRKAMAGEAPSRALPTVGPALARTEKRNAFGRERLRDYVGAFVLAGLDPQVGAELEFFAPSVNYFGEAGVNRDKIRRDLSRYDQRWPNRRFWLAGDVQVEAQSDNRLRVTFPLGFELHNANAGKSGAVQKTLLLERSDDDLRIVAVNERKVR